MNTTRIYSQNAAFQKFTVLKTNRNKRYRYGQFLVEGVRNINFALEAGWTFDHFLYPMDRALSGWANDLLARVPTQENFALAPDLMALLSGKTDTSELLAILRMRADEPDKLLTANENPLYVLFDRPSNHGNLGTLIRSMDALGAAGLIVTGHGVDLYDPDVVTATMGSFFRVRAVRAAEGETLFALISALRARYPGFLTVGTTAHKQMPIDKVDLTRPALLMIGSEADGLSRALKEACDVLATIPMTENCAASSLNVSCAATVMLYEAARQRMNGGKD